MLSPTLFTIVGDSLIWLARFLLQPSHVVLIAVFWFVGSLYYKISIRPRFFSPMRGVSGPPVRVSLLGHFREIMRSEPGMAEIEWTRTYGPVVRTVGPFGGERMILLRPEALQKILVSDWADYERPKPMRNLLGLVAGYGLLTTSGNEHKQMRHAMNPAFALSNLMNQTDMYFDTLDVLVSVMRFELNGTAEGKVFHMYEWMSKATMDIICATAFGYSSNSLRDPHNPLTRAYGTLTSLQSGPTMAKIMTVVMLPFAPTLLNSRLGRMLAPVIRWLPLFGPPVATLVETTHEMRELSRGILREKLMESEGEIKGDRESKKDIMSLLVRARQGSASDGYQLSDEALVDQVLTFLGAGHETSCSGLSWALWLLATHPEVQSQLRTELEPIFATNDRPSYRDLKELKLLDCVVMEALRLLPPVPTTVRQAGKDDWIDGTFIPKGTLLYISIRAINTYAPVWGSDAAEFKPERWLKLPPTYNATFSFQSFITGPHGCIGKTMAISEMKAVLAAMIANFDFCPSYKDQTAKPTAGVTMKPADNMPLLVKSVKRM
ncbi:cytochrome P450 [Peniophora sp. CONT]|nr:cytochrome P450 [Peniophora sp. CONT]